MLTLKIFAGLTFVASIIWAVNDPGYESGISALASIVTFVGLWIKDKPQKQSLQQNQLVSDNSVGIQADGDIHIGTLNHHGNSGNAK